MNSALTYLLARAQEPSTYAGISVMLASLGVHINDAAYQAVAHTLSAIAALIGVFMKEKSNAPVDPAKPTQNS